MNLEPSLNKLPLGDDKQMCFFFIRIISLLFEEFVWNPECQSVAHPDYLFLIYVLGLGSTKVVNWNSKNLL